MIVVTGTGIITGLGAGVDHTLSALLASRSAVGIIENLSTIHSEIPCAEVRYSDRQMMYVLGIDPSIDIHRSALMGIIAAKEAVKNSGLSSLTDSRIGFINGTTVGGMDKSEIYYSNYLNDNTRNGYIAIHEGGACTDIIEEHLSLKGVCYTNTLSTACSSAANAIILGANMIKSGLLDVVIAGGTECITKFHLNGFRSLMILDKEPCRPFDRSRAGLNLGEGAAYIVLESYEHALKRGANALCTLSGYGNACDAYHQTASSEEGIGAAMAMREALSMASLNSSEIDYINAHGTGTPNNDASEGRAIISIFGDHIPPVSSTKAMTGHTTSASGSVEAVISILALNNGFIPANLNFSEQMPELTFSPVSQLIENIDMNHILSNSFGFGGNNSTLIFSRI